MPDDPVLLAMPAVLDALRRERVIFLDLLRSLEPDDWTHATECPAYDVQGVAAHVLGDDISLLSRQRDAATNGLARYLGELDFRGALDRFNDTWVDTVTFFSPVVIVDLLQRVGEWTLDWYSTVDAESLGEPVGFFGARGPSPYWQIAAREYAERWIHHHQIRRALRRADVDDAALLITAADVILLGIAAGLRRIDRPTSTTVTFSIVDVSAWTLARNGDAWTVRRGATDAPAAHLSVERSHAPTLLSRGLPIDEVRGCLEMTGDADILDAFARFVARP